MTISGISPYMPVQRVYAYTNTHYNQIANTSVQPVTRVPSAKGISGKENDVRLAATYQINGENFAPDGEKSAERTRSALAESYQAQQSVSYDLTNPYEMQRMGMESSLLPGMNFDMVA